jgi:hypothetical protein
MRTTSLEELRSRRRTAESGPVLPGTPCAESAPLCVCEAPSTPPVASSRSSPVSPKRGAPIYTTQPVCKGEPRSEAGVAEAQERWPPWARGARCTCAQERQWSCDDSCLRTSCAPALAPTPVAGGSFDDIAVPARCAIRSGLAESDAGLRGGPPRPGARAASAVLPAPWQGDAVSPTWGGATPLGGSRDMLEAADAAAVDLAPLPHRSRDDLYLLQRRDRSPRDAAASVPSPHFLLRTLEDLSPRSAPVAAAAMATVPLEFQEVRDRSPRSAVEWHPGRMSMDTAPWATTSGPDGPELGGAQRQRHAHAARLRAFRDEPFSSGRCIAAQWLQVPAVPLLPGTHCHDDAMVPEGTGGSARWLASRRHSPWARSLSVASRNASRSPILLSPEVPRLAVASSLASEGSDWPVSHRDGGAATVGIPALMRARSAAAAGFAFMAEATRPGKFASPAFAVSGEALGSKGVRCASSEVGVAPMEECAALDFTRGLPDS